MASAVSRDDLLDPDERSRLLPKQKLRDPSGVEASTTSFIEAADVYKSRWRSIRCLYLIMFLSSISFTVTMASIWPYLQLVDTSATTDFLGWVVAAYSLGQLIASPLFGVWANKRHTSREPLLITLVISIGANIMYAYMESFPSNRGAFLLLSRFLIGFGAGNVAVVRSYIAGATTLKERTEAMANLSIFQSMGFVLGPGFQAALVPIGYPGPVHSTGLHLDLYTTPAFISALMAVISIVLILAIFKEHRIIDDSEFRFSVQSEGGEYQVPDYKPDYVAVISTIGIFFVVLFIFTNFETIGTPLTMNMYAWSKASATLYQGILLLVGGVISIFAFLVVKTIAKRVNERYLLIGGFVFCMVGYVIWLPWGSILPARTVATLAPAVTISTPASASNDSWLEDAPLDFIFKNDADEVTDPSADTPFTSSSDHTSASVSTTPFMTSSSEHHIVSTSQTVEPYTSWHTTVEPSNTTANTTVEPKGCPWYYGWCDTTPEVSFPQYLCGAATLTVGYPVTQVMTYTLFSKILGPKPQGFWMGMITAAGSLARTVGPIFVSQIYDAAGPRVTFATSAGIIALTIVGIIVVFRRLVPFSFPDETIVKGVN